MLGPSLPDLAFNTDTSLKKYNIVFFCRAFGTLSGTITAGYLVDHFNYCFFLPFAAFAHAACYYFIPFTNNIWLVAVCISCSGLTSSVIATGGNVAILEVWSGENERKLQSSILQALHGFYAVGGVLSSPIARPFLGVFPTPDEVNITSTGDCSKAEKNETLLIRDESDNLSMLYTIVSGALVFVGLSILVQWKLNSKPIRKLGNSEDNKAAEITLNRDEMILAGMLFIFMISIVGAEVTYTQFLFTYAQRTLGLSREMCTLMNTVFWLCFCLFRLLATFISRILSPRLMITANLSACIIASILLYIAVHPALVWMSVGLFGAGLASTYPTTFSYAQKFVKITGKFASRFAIGGAIGWMTIPTITLYFFERYCRSMPLIGSFRKISKFIYFFKFSKNF